MRILFLDRTTDLETIHDLKTKGRGGMVTSLFKVSDYLASAGHDVTVLSDIKRAGVTDAGTKWLDDHCDEYDVLITNRSIGAGYSDIRAKHRVLWTHDLPHSGFIPEPKNMAAYDRVVFMSRYAERIWRTFYKTIGKSVLIPNGVDKEVFYPRPKTMDKMIYASAPNRGLDKLPLILDSIRSRVELRREVWDGLPGFCELDAFSNLAKLHPGESNDNFNYTPVEESEVNLCDPVPQDVLANKLGEAGLMILPTAYPEICSNIVLQSLVSGTPVITTGGLGSVPEWVKHKKNGMLTQFYPHDYMIHIIEMVRNAETVLSNGKLHKKLIEGAVRTKVLDWNEVGAKWERMLKRV